MMSFPGEEIPLPGGEEFFDYYEASRMPAGVCGCFIEIAKNFEIHLQF